MNKNESKQTTTLFKTLSMSRVCPHPYSYCRTLACCTSWVWKHPCFAKEQNLSLVHCMLWVWRHQRFAKEQNLSLVHCMSWVWRHLCFLKGQDRILSLCASTLSSHFATVIHWHRTLFLFFCLGGGGGGGIGFDRNVICCLQLTWGYSGLLFNLFFCMAMDILKNQF